MVYTKEKVTVFLQSSGWKIIAIKQTAQGWHCRITTTTNFEVRLNHCKKALNATVLTMNSPVAEVLVPLPKAIPSPKTVKQPEAKSVPVSKTLPIPIDSIPSPIHQQLWAGGWEILSIKQTAQGWHCRITTTTRFDARLKHCKDALHATVLAVDEPIAVLLFPVPTTATPPPSTVKQTEAKPASVVSPTRPIAIDSVPSPIHQLLYLYHETFGKVGTCHIIDEQHFTVAFTENVSYPVNHPFVALLSEFMPDIVPILISTELTTSAPVTTFYFAPVQQRVEIAVSGLSIYADGSFRDGLSAYGVQYLMKGEPIIYRSGVLRGTDSFSAELMALLEAVSHVEPTAKEVTIYTDSLNAIRWLQNDGQDWWAKIITKIPQLSVQHIPREQNTVAHRLAYNLITKLFGG